MLYRETGQFKTSYAADQALYPIRADRLGMAAILATAFLLVPLFAGPFLLNTILIPFLIFALAAIGLNLLTGYAGLISLGTGAFMGVGAYACYKLTTWLPDANILLLVLLSGGASAAMGVLFGLPSLRIKGFYLAVATLAAQFFLDWCFNRIPWLYNGNASGAIEVPTRTAFSLVLTGPTASPLVRYLAVLTLVAGLTWLAANLMRGRIGRSWMMVRDMDIAAELMGVRLLPTKLLAFAVSSFYVGVAGALMVFLWLGAAEASSFGIELSFQVLFMVIIGGLGRLQGAFLGAAFIWGLPILIRALPPLLGLPVAAAQVEHLTSMIVGALIVLILILEPHGCAGLWQTVKQRLRTWPFPY
ncbi:MAG: branched-chain amino acid ABC transporter permease [Geminicoccaceae bacterium]